MDTKSPSAGRGRNPVSWLIAGLVIVYLVPVVAGLNGFVRWGLALVDYQRTFHPTGQILFHCKIQYGRDALCAVKADGSAPEILDTDLKQMNGSLYADLPHYVTNYLSWSPDWKRVAFPVKDHDHGNSLLLAKADGAGVTELLNDSGRIGKSSWSPDGTTLAFTKFSDAEKAGSIYTIRVDRSGMNQISTFGAGPAWSPDGKRIAFTHQEDGIYIYETDSGKIHQIANGISAAFLAWSPDGSKIIFSTYHGPGDKSTGLGLINADGANQKLLKGEFYLPAWSPDGKKIAYLCGAASLCAMNEDGSGQAMLGAGSAPFAWSPDGQYIVYLGGESFCPFCYTAPAGALSIMKADGSQNTKLIERFGNAFVAGFNSTVIWRPTP